MNITQLDNEALKRLLADDSTVQVVDVRTPEEYGYLGHIPQARLLPVYELPARWRELERDKKTVLICEHGVRSLDASYYMAHLGFPHVYNLTHGMAAWDGAREYAQESPAH